MERGYLQIYTGDGKGKTTAAFGVALRAALSGNKVYIGQFIKGMKYTETEIEHYLPNIEIEQLGESCFIEKEPKPSDIALAVQGFEAVRKKIMSGQYHLVILDEVTIALYYKLFTVEALIDVIQNRPPHVELILTGRYCPDELVQIADLVTEMKEIKHYYTQGVLSRKGIDC